MKLCRGMSQHADAMQFNVASTTNLLQDSVRDLDVSASSMGGPGVAPSTRIVSCTYHQWFMPFSKHNVSYMSLAGVFLSVWPG